MINEEKLKYSESLRALENQKREIMSIIDSERMRTNALLHDTKDSIMLLSNEKVERAKDEIYNKIRELERVSCGIDSVKCLSPMKLSSIILRRIREGCRFSLASKKTLSLE